MKQHTNWLAASLAIGCVLGLASSALADATISSFDNYTSDALYASWSSATIVSGATNYSVTATNYGSNYKYIGFPAINGAGNTTVQLTVTLSGAPAADGKLGPLIQLIDGDGTTYAYRWYGQTLGHHVLTMPVNSPSAILAAGSTPGLDLTTLTHSHLELDPSSYSGGYTVSWEDLSLVGAVAPPSGCGTLASFDNFNLDGTYASWTAGTSTPTNFQESATGFGGGYKAISTFPSSSGLTLQLDVTLSGMGADVIAPIVVLEDGTGNQMQYAWYNQPVGNHVLTKVLSTGNLVAGPGPFNYSTISFFHLQIDPEGFAGAYTAAWNDLSIIGCANSGIQITSPSYNPATHQFTLTWSSTPASTYTIRHTSSLLSPFNDLVTGIASGGTSTTTTVTVPTANAGFLQVKKE
jgi:hypothetical protein